MGNEFSHGLEWCRAPFEIQLHCEVASWTLARMCGVRRSDLTAAAASSQAARGPPSVLSESGRLQTVTMLSGILSEFLSDILSLAFDLAYTNIYWHFRLKLLTNNLQWSHSRDHVPLFFFSSLWRPNCFSVASVRPGSTNVKTQQVKSLCSKRCKQCVVNNNVINA